MSEKAMKFGFGALAEMGGAFSMHQLLDIQPQTANLKIMELILGIFMAGLAVGLVVMPEDHKSSSRSSNRRNTRTRV